MCKMLHVLDKDFMALVHGCHELRSQMTVAAIKAIKLNAC